MALKMAAGFEVLADVASGDAAVAAVVDHDADLVLLDLRMPGLDGIDAARAIRDQCPATTIVLLTGSLHEDVPAEAAEVVDAVLTKALRPQELAAALGALPDRRPQTDPH